MGLASKSLGFRGQYGTEHNTLLCSLLEYGWDLWHPIFFFINQHAGKPKDRNSLGNLTSAVSSRMFLSVGTSGLGGELRLATGTLGASRLEGIGQIHVL